MTTAARSGERSSSATVTALRIVAEMLKDVPLGVSLGYERFGSHNEVVLLTTSRFRHQYCIGGSGTGKTTGLVHQAVQDINNRTPIMFFDPGNAVDQIVQRVDKRRLEDLIILDLTDPECRINLNMLYINADGRELVSRICEEVIEILRGLVPFSWAGARFEQKVRLAIMTILDKDFCYPRSIRYVGPLINDRQFRLKVLKKIKTPYVLNGWETEDTAMLSNENGEVNQWVYSKFDIYDTNSVLRQMFGSGKPSLDIEEIMASGKSLLVKIDQSVIGSKVAEVLTHFFVTQIKRAVLKRDHNDEDLQPYFLYFDEFQRFAGEAFVELLNEARKKKVGLILAHHNLRELTPFSRTTESFNSELLESVLANVGTLVAFKPSARDAAVLGIEFDVPADALRRVPPYCATVRLLSDGQAMPPKVVAVPRPPQVVENDNLAVLKARMKAERIWLTDESEQVDAYVAAKLKQVEKAASDEQESESNWAGLFKRMDKEYLTKGQIDLSRILKSKGRETKDVDDDDA